MIWGVGVWDVGCGCGCGGSAVYSMTDSGIGLCGGGGWGGCMCVGWVYVCVVGYACVWWRDMMCCFYIIHAPVPIHIHTHSIHTPAHLHTPYRVAWVGAGGRCSFAATASATRAHAMHLLYNNRCLSSVRGMCVCVCV